MENKYNDKQYAVIRFNSGSAVVLGSHGCDKTNILALRVLMAHQIYGVAYSDMLCLTFTNHAKHELKKKIITVAGDVMKELSVNTFQQFCLRFLFENNLIGIDTEITDEDDILKLTYSALSSEKARDYKYSSFKWIQVDEVQKLNSVQLAIIKLLTAKDYSSLLYWGNEKMSITLLVGGRHDCITDLRNNTAFKLFDLSEMNNSDMYIQDLLVGYAIEQFGVEPALLPENTNQPSPYNTLVTVNYKTKGQGYDVVSAISRNLSYQALEKTRKEGGDIESTCILVHSDFQADELSEQLEAHGIRHVKLAKNDAFNTINFKTIYSHFSVIVNDFRYTDWIRILFQTHTLATMDLARRFVKKTRELALSPLDLMFYDQRSYFIDFCNSYRNKEIVVFQLKTTGSNIFNDDVVRISAVKIKNGIQVPNTELNIIIDEQNADSLNTMTPQKGVELFVKYVGQDELLTHDADFNVHILEKNIKRYSCGIKFENPVCWDTQKMSRRLNPDLIRFSLDALIDVYGLNQKNLEYDLDSVQTVKVLAEYCYHKMCEKTSAQMQFISHPEVRRIQNHLRTEYMPLFLHTSKKLYDNIIDDEHTFDSEFNYVYNELLRNKSIGSIKTFQYIRKLFRKALIDKQGDLYFYQQLTNHLYELQTFNEVEFSQFNVLPENLFVMTVDKAGDFEFDNVVIHDAFFRTNSDSDTSNEDGREMYYAMSLARRRIFITYGMSLPPLISNHSNVSKHFIDMSYNKINAILQLEKIAERQESNANK